MKYRGIIFDLDGVICTTDEQHYRAWKSFADKIGVYFDREINNRLRGVSRMDCVDIILEKSDKRYTAEEKLAFATEKNAAYVASLSDLTSADADPDVVATLKELRARGIKTAIGSSSRNARLILSRLGLTELFDAISDGNNISRSKPDPEVFLKAASFLGLEPTDCLVVEDAFSGIDAGVAGGFDTAAIGDAAKYDKPLYKLTKLSDLLPLTL